MTMLEAARCPPSSYTSQPWRFLYARRQTAGWDRFLDLLVPADRDRAEDAATLVVLVSNAPGPSRPLMELVFEGGFLPA